ncbi:hypothetical protein [Streptomyces melanosporofaciens]|uniref:hypothetical protein n=1 Tax=Streptomyces melanosporofaciens TaxID=67327 RepID=UPI0014307031|nr:hypothetical protein [Streptomyces melanosporofaciens]
MGDLLTIAGLPATGSLPATGNRRPATGDRQWATPTGDLLTTGDRPLVILFQYPGPEVSHFETPATYTVEGL